MKAPYQRTSRFAEGRTAARRLWLSPKGNGFYEEVHAPHETVTTNVGKEEALVKHAEAAEEYAFAVALPRVNIPREVIMVPEKPRFVAPKKP